MVKLQDAVQSGVTMSFQHIQSGFMIHAVFLSQYIQYWGVQHRNPARKFAPCGFGLLYNSFCSILGFFSLSQNLNVLSLHWGTFQL